MVIAALIVDDGVFSSLKSVYMEEMSFMDEEYEEVTFDG